MTALYHTYQVPAVRASGSWVEKLSSAGANGVERKILVYARPDEKEDCLQADEVVPLN